MWWIWFILAIAAVKCLLGVAGFVAALLGAAPLDPGLSLPAVSLIHIVSYALVGAFLLWAGRKDARAVRLGTAFVLIASSSSDRLLIGLSATKLPVLPGVAEAVFHLQPEVFLPLFLWLFFAEFPRSSAFGATRTVPRTAVRICACAGIALFGLLAFESLLPPHGRPLQSPTRDATLGLYTWAILVALTLPALFFAVWKTRTAPIGERRRVRLFLTGLGIGFVPMLLALLLEAFVPPFARAVRNPDTRRTVGLFLRMLLIVVPATTAYSVLRDQVLDVRLYLRKAIQYALTRYALLAVATVPFLILAGYVYVNRQETVVELLSGSRLGLALAGTTGLLGLRVRRRLSVTIDRRFFREQYDAKQILAELVDRGRETRTADELGRLLESEINRALHLESIAVLQRVEGSGELRSPDNAVRPLALSSGLAGLLAGSADPLEIDLESPGSPLRRLGQDEREWLGDGGFCLLVPLLASDNSLLGLIGLGEKRSELPFSREDRLLLTAIASAAALSMENRLLLSPLPKAGSGLPAPTPVMTDQVHLREPLAAMECIRCHRIQPGADRVCQDCGGNVAGANVPCLLRGKFRFERKVGAGGMGIVYEARDLELDRKVAIKTLPRMSPEHSRRLRQEARTMAAVSHPNLAAIFGAETWRGTPLLVFEFLEGGTLADRLRAGRLDPGETLELGIVLCGVLSRLHAAGILHRDIKPSNIGYNADGVPKLMDLGLAKIFHHSLDREAQQRTTEGPGQPPVEGPARAQPDTLESRVVGTLAYLSPEALTGYPPEPVFDLWSLSVVLFESLTATHPFMGATSGVTLNRILTGQAADLSRLIPACPRVLTILFSDLLARDLGRRPLSARELRARLETTKIELGSAAGREVPV